MKLIAKVKLQTEEVPFRALLDTLHKANECCNWISEQAWNGKTFSQFKIHKLVYKQARETFGLTAQVVVRCIAKVADSYKLDKKTKRTYRKDGAIAFDDRILRWHIEHQVVSIWTTSGRLKIPFLCGDKQKQTLRTRQGESDLIFHRGSFYLAAVCNVDEPRPEIVDEFLGVDLGISNLATDSSGKRYSGSHVKSVRHRHCRLRTKLQKKQTKSATRRLKQLSGKERRFATDTNHVISKRLVVQAQGTKQAIVLEDLQGIRLRITVRRSQRAILHSWAFSQLRTFVEYKAKLAGVTVVHVDAAYSSRTCSQCGHCEKANRPSQEKFLCRQCGYSTHADFNAATVLRERGRAAYVNRPNVADCEFIAHDSVTSPRALAVGD